MSGAVPVDVRTRHPFHTHDEIHLQPHAVARAVALVEERGAEAAGAIARARRVFVTGCGTSLHAARGGAWFLRSFSRGAIDARSVSAFELSTYFSVLRPDDLVIALTHSGGTPMTAHALHEANRAGADTIVITGFPESQAGRIARHVVHTGYGEERSWAHTVSYTAALASMAAIANTLADAHQRLDLSPLPDLLTDVLRLEEVVHRMAASSVIAENAHPLRLALVGGGPNASTADEGALKLLETCYLNAMSFELEQFLHGPLAAIDETCAVIVIAPSGQSTNRVTDLYRALQELGVRPLMLCSEENASAFDEAHRLALPDFPEVLSPIPYVVPLQLFSYFIAVGKGLNPDLIHRDDERQRSARAQYK
ncbi:MAG: hypothetical protein NVS2B16_25700 [Chloroflexota bacterium]